MREIPVEVPRKCVKCGEPAKIAGYYCETCSKAIKEKREVMLKNGK